MGLGKCHSLSVSSDSHCAAHHYLDPLFVTLIGDKTAKIGESSVFARLHNLKKWLFTSTFAVKNVGQCCSMFCVMACSFVRKHVIGTLSEGRVACTSIRGFSLLLFVLPSNSSHTFPYSYRPAARYVRPPARRARPPADTTQASKDTVIFFATVYMFLFSVPCTFVEFILFFNDDVYSC